LSLDSGLSTIEVCQQVSSAEEDYTAFIIRVSSSGHKCVVGYQYGGKKYGAFIIFTYVGKIEFVYNNGDEWNSKSLLI